MRNEQQAIRQCLDSIVQNEYPVEHLEILVFDGYSTDDSREIAEAYAKQYPFIRVVPNPRKIQSAALNLGLDRASGEIILRMDAHTVYARDYIFRCVKALLESGAANVGGVQRAGQPQGRPGR